MGHCGSFDVQLPLWKINVMVVVGISVLFILLILGLLLVPVEIYIDTASNQYYLQLKGLARLNLESDTEEVLRVRLRTFFRNFYFYPLKKIGEVNTNKLERPKVKRRKKNIPFRKILRLVNSFKIKKMFVDIDTGNCISNAKLYPVFAFLNHYRKGFNINFEGRNQVVLLIRNRPIHIIKSFINP